MAFLIFEITNLTSDLLEKLLEQVGGFWVYVRIRYRFDLMRESYNQKILISIWVLHFSQNNLLHCFNNLNITNFFK